MTNSLSFDELCKTARSHMEAGRLPEALALFNEALQANELDCDVHDALGTVHFLMKNYDGAVQHFERATRLDTRRGTSWINLGAVYNRLEKYQKAAEVLRRAVQIERKSSAAYYNLGFAYRHLKQWSLAVPAYREAIRLDPKMTDAYYNLGKVYVAMKNYAQAAAQFKKALELNPKMEKAERGLEQVEAELQAAKDKESPFGRLVNEKSLKTTTESTGSARHLSRDERQADRRELGELYARMDGEVRQIVAQLGDNLLVKVKTLEKMLTQALDPHSVSITKEEALEQFEAVRNDLSSQLSHFQTSIRQLREHEAQYR